MNALLLLKNWLASLRKVPGLGDWAGGVTLEGISCPIFYLPLVIILVSSLLVYYTKSVGKIKK